MAKGAGPTVAPKPSRGGGGTVGFTGMTPKQFAKYVNAQVGSMYNPEFKALRGYQAGVDKQFGNEIGETNLGSTELAQMFAQIAPTIKGYYDQAANNDTAYAKGFQDVLGSVAPGVEPGVGSVLSTMYGLLPGETLQQQGAGMESAAATLPTTAEGLATAADNAISGHQSQSDLAMEGKLATLLGEEGKARETVSKDLLSESLANARMRNTIANDNRNYGIKVANLGLSKARLQLSSERFAREIFQQNRQYSLSMARLGISERGLQLRIAKEAYAAANGGISQKDMMKYEEQANSIANDSYSGTTVYRTRTVNGVATQVPVHEGGVPYNQALSEMLRKGIPVQVALKSLDHVYPKQYRPSATQLEHILGGLTPQSIMNQIQGQQAYAQAGNDILGATFSGPVSARAAANPQGAKNAAFRMAAGYGWGDRGNLTALEELWTRESGWSYTAKNASSGALGIPQALGHKLPPGYESNPLIQIRWGLNYIKGRYGSPLAAWEHETRFGWY